MARFRRLGEADARVIADALCAMAQADGAIDPLELEVIARFLRACAAPETTPEPRAPDAESLRRAADGLHDAFLCACAMLAFADGDFTAEEAALIRRYASDLGVPEKRLRELVALVEREQAMPHAPPPMRPLLESLAAWARAHFPSLRPKADRLAESPDKSA
jgi:tellurite resistance protein